MHTKILSYNNFESHSYFMNQKVIQIVPEENEKQGKSSGLFFPRIIREFDDGSDEKPMIYGGDRS